MSTISAQSISASYHVGSRASNGRLFGATTSSIAALRNVSFEIASGDRVAVIGANGSGKSSLLKVLSGVIPVTEGQLVVKGRCLSILDRYFGLIPHASVRENAMCKAFSLGLNRTQARVFAQESIDTAGLNGKANLPLSTLSTGMAGRFNLAINSKVVLPIMILDEWIGTLDTSQAGATGLLSGLNKDAEIVVMASHNEALVRTLCNKVLLLDNGELKYFGSDFDHAYDELNQMQGSATSRSLPGASNSQTDSKRNLYFLHPYKTGRRLTHKMLDGVEGEQYRIHVMPAGTTLDEIPVGEKVVLFYRSPIERVARLFSARQRKGAPFNFGDWTAGEHIAFSEYSKLEDLLSDLASPQRNQQFHALKQLQKIQFINDNLETCFGPIDELKQRADDVFSIACADELLTSIGDILGDLGISLDLYLEKVSTEKLDYFTTAFADGLSEQQLIALSDSICNELEYYQQFRAFAQSQKSNK